MKTCPTEPPLGALETGLAVYLLTSIVVIAGVTAGLFMDPSAGVHSPPHFAASGDPLLDTFTYWDGQWYLQVAQEGYYYNPDGQSSVAFFPGYPIAIRAASEITRLPLDWSALLVSHAFLMATFVLVFAYVRQRFPDAPAKLRLYVLLALGLFPTTFFMRMAYSESMFVFLTVLAMCGMQRNWRLWRIAAIVGLATATRLTGIALLFPLTLHVWNRTDSPRRAARSLAVALPLALSGFIGFVLYQYLTFGEPFGFIKTQDFWCENAPQDLSDKILGLASWEPIWSAYMPSAPGYVWHVSDAAPALLSLQYANPVFFVAAVALVVAGAWKGWLSRGEVFLSAGLILIPYAAKGFEMCMASQGRFAAGAFPIYIVLGHILSRLPRPWAFVILALFATYLAIYSAMLAAGYVLI